MTEPGTGDGASEEDARDRAIRAFVTVLGSTPMIVATTGSLGEISTGTAVPAGLVGAAAGVPAFVLVDRFDYRLDFCHVNDAVALVAMLALVPVAVAVTWLVVPPGATSTFVVGCLAFLWAMALGGVSRHVVWPRFAPEAG